MILFWSCYSWSNPKRSSLRLILPPLYYILFQSNSFVLNMFQFHLFLFFFSFRSCWLWWYSIRYPLHSIFRSTFHFDLVMFLARSSFHFIAVLLVFQLHLFPAAFLLCYDSTFSRFHSISFPMFRVLVLILCSTGCYSICSSNPFYPPPWQFVPNFFQYCTEFLPWIFIFHGTYI